jgi:hypothetical protein
MINLNSCDPRKEIIMLRHDYKPNREDVSVWLHPLLIVMPDEWGTITGQLHAPEWLRGRNKVATTTCLSIGEHQGLQLIGNNGRPAQVNEIFVDQLSPTSLHLDHAGARDPSFKQVQKLVKYYVRLGYVGTLLYQAFDPKCDDKLLASVAIGLDSTDPYPQEVDSPDLPVPYVSLSYQDTTAGATHISKIKQCCEHFCTIIA